MQNLLSRPKPPTSQDQLNLAVQHHQAGRLRQAAGIYHTILTREPTHANTLHLLGVVELQQGNAARAAQLIRQAVDQQPHIPTFHCHLALAYHASGRADRAIVHCRAALRLQPNNADAANTLGLALQELGEIAEAARQFRATLQLQPDFAAAHVNLGNALRSLGDVEQAMESFRQALRIDGNLAVAHANLGQLLLEKRDLPQAFWHCGTAARLCPTLPQAHVSIAGVYAEQGRDDDAIRAYQNALKADPTCAEACNGLGRLLLDQGRFEDAKSYFRDALRHGPRLVAAQCNLGDLHEVLGDFDEAERCFRAALRLDPGNANALGQLATLLRGKLPAEDVAQMRRLLDDSRLRDVQRASLHFGLAQTLDARGDYRQAGAHLRHANRLSLAHRQERGEVYDPGEHERLVDELIGAFTPAFFERTKGFGLDSERPIFVVGLPRSGTTLVEQILASHVQVFGAGELSLAHDDLEAIPALSPRGRSPFECLPGLSPQETRTIGRRHLDRLGELAGAKTDALRIVDKMPDNYLYLGLLATLFPRAKFIHCRRDLRDVAFSCWMTNFRSIRWASAADHIAGRFAQYLRLMDHWRSRLPVPVLEVNYEETVANLEGTARRVIDFCGLEWQPQCLAFHKTRRAVRTASTTQVRQPIYTRSVARWKHYETDLRDLFEALPQQQLP